MIPRYSRPQMAGLWADRNRYSAWLRVEAAVCGQLAKDGVIPRKDWGELKKRIEKLQKNGGVEPARVEALEAVTKHDVIAFTTAVAEQVGPLSRYIHYGLTSSDVVDTALSLVIQEAGQQIILDIERLLKTLKKLAIRYQKLPCIGRTHGIFAEPTSFGLKFLGWYSEWSRNEKRWKAALKQMGYGKLSGAVGVNAHWSPEFEEKVLKSLGLEREPVSTQILPRDRHGELFQTISLLGCGLERMAVELRHLQRSEVAEVREGFSRGQKGSSAMPHKRNPISAENISGCSRLLRAYSQAALENVPLWHERDISHSSVERVSFPDAFLVLDYSLHRMTGILENLIVDGKAVGANLAKAGSSVFSGHFLLELVNAGATREDAYAWVQSCALASFEGKGEFVELLAQHSEIKTRIPVRRLKELGSVRYQLRFVPEIYKKVFSG